MTKYLFFISIFTAAIVNNLSAQNISSQTRLANEYFQNKEFDKAEALYKELYESTRSDFYFNHYISSLAEQNNYDEALRQIRREMRRNRDDLNFYADLAYIYKKQGETEKANNTVEEAIAQLPAQKHQIFKLANSLMRRQEYDYTIEVYKQAEAIIGRPYNREMANIYAVQRKYPEMINKYMDWVEENPSNIPNVQTQLSHFLGRDHDGSFYNIMRTELIKRIQKRGAAIQNNQMLMWLYLQNKDFSQALIQAKAIERRTFSSGRNIRDIAQAAKNSQDYATAKNAYEFLIDQGRDNAFYIDARLGYLNLSYRQIKEGLITDKEQIKAIEQDFSNTISSFGVGTETIESIINLSHIQAFYLNQPQKADSLLQRAVNLRGLAPELAGRCKIARADILLLQGDLWEAALIYAQAESENQDHPVGDEAKLKKAFLAYYGNQFEWALAQFNALKKSTSKPIANDALKYSVFIQEYSSDEGENKEISMYARADLLDFQNNKVEALKTLDSLSAQFPAHPIIADSYLKKAMINKELGDYNESEKYFKKLYTEYRHSILTPRAVYELGVLYENHLMNKEEAIYYYTKLITDHPESIHTNNAAIRLRALRASTSGNMISS